MSGGYGEMVRNSDELYEKLKAFFLEKKSYNKKDAASHNPTRTRQTVTAILNGVDAYEKLAENN
jgi:hypothetical protein